MNSFEALLETARESHYLHKDEIIKLLQVEGRQYEKLLSVADEVRQEYLGDEVHLRALIEFSNYCRRNCYYCGLRRDNDALSRYRMQPGEIHNAARQAAQIGYKTIVLQSGEDKYYSSDTISELITNIKEEADLAVTLSLGEHSYQDYQKWYKTGADRYLLRHETSDEQLYQKLHPGMKLKERLKSLKWLKEIGYQVGSGNLLGLPGQTLESIAEDILLFKELELDMVGLGPFISNPDTPLNNAGNGSVQLTLKVMAITRLLLPQTLMPATTALGTLDPLGREKGLQAGANVLMPNVTPVDVRPQYALYPDKICANEDSADCRGCIEARVLGIGRTIATGYGHSLKSSPS